MSNTMRIRLLQRGDAEAMLALRVANREFLRPFEPERDDDFFTLATQEAIIARGLEDAYADRAYLFGMFAGRELVGRIALTNVVRGSAQMADMGYFVAQAHNGKGYATQAVSQLVRHAFEELRLHRIQAGVMPRNVPSLRVLEKAGFRREGLAERYIRINGAWEDHVLLAVTAEEFGPRNP